jgi:hypothetical protein
VCGDGVNPVPAFWSTGGGPVALGKLAASGDILRIAEEPQKLAKTLVDMVDRQESILMSHFANDR